MQPISVTVGSATTSNWIPLNTKKPYFATSLFVGFPATCVLTYSVQHANPNNTDGHSPVSGNDAGVLAKLTRSTTTATLIWPDHGLTTSDSLIVQGAGGTMDGTYAVASVVDANTLTYTVTNSGITTAKDGFQVLLLKVFNHASLVGLSAAANGNYAFPVPFVRLNVTAYTSGKATLTVVSG